MKIKITADSTCDLPVDLIQKYNIDIVPLYIVDGKKTLRDGIDINAEAIFDKVRSGGEICSTAAVNVTDYIEVFSKLRERYDAIVHINISSELSACHQNAMIAAEEVKNVYPVDSMSLSTASGHLVLDAAMLAAGGIEAAEIQKEMTKRCEKIDTSFVLDTLEYLRRGGRCSAITAFGANLLNIKPCIEMKDGKLGLGKKYRGNLEKTFFAYITDKLKDQDDVDYRRIFITHSGLSDELLEKLRDLVLEYGTFDEVIINKAGCTISNHCGPSAMGILFYRK